MVEARITLRGEDPAGLDEVIKQIKDVAKTLNMEFKGPIPFPRKRLRITTRRTPCGRGSDTYEHWEKRISKRLVVVKGDETNIRQILRIRVPDTVAVKISLVEN